MRAFEPQAGFTHMAPNRSSFNQRTNIEDSQLVAVIDAKNYKLCKFARMGARFKRHWTIVTYKPQCQCNDNKTPYPSMSCPCERRLSSRSKSKHPQLDEADTRTPDNSDHFLFFADNCDCDAGLTVTCACAVQDPE